jgi:hypothetical protein
MITFLRGQVKLKGVNSDRTLIKTQIKEEELKPGEFIS